MAILVCVSGRDNSKLMQQLRAYLPEVEIFEWPNCDKLNDINFVLAWNAPEALWAQLPNLKVVESYGAGVDSMGLSAIPDNVVIARVVDEQLAADMAEYVLTHILAHKLRLREYMQKQSERNWHPRRVLKHRQVGILGLGELGLTTANKLIVNGFSVRGWSKNEKSVNGIECFAGSQNLRTFLTDLDYLVCLLPLTAQTTGILNRQLFEQVPNHCVLINVARGKHLNDEDLIWALDNGQLAGATLDVFNDEPLVKQHPFWSHPLITMTPHCAALTDLSNVCEKIALNARACINNEKLENVINREQGY